MQHFNWTLKINKHKMHFHKGDVFPSVPHQICVLCPPAASWPTMWDAQSHTLPLQRAASSGESRFPQSAKKHSTKSPIQKYQEHRKAKLVSNMRLKIPVRIYIPCFGLWGGWHTGNLSGMLAVCTPQLTSTSLPRTLASLAWGCI